MFDLSDSEFCHSDPFDDVHDEGVAIALPKSYFGI